MPTTGVWLNPLLRDASEQNIVVQDFPVVVGFHAPVRIARRGARHRTAHLPAQLSEKRSDSGDLTRVG